MSTLVHRYMGATGTPVAQRDGNQIYGPGYGTPIAVIQGNYIWPGPAAVGAAPYYCDGQCVYAGGPGGPIIFNIRDNGSNMSIGDGMGASHHLMCEAHDPMALAGAAVAWIGEMRFRNPGADVVDGDTFGTEVGGTNPYMRDDAHDYHNQRDNGGFRWAGERVPSSLDSFGDDMPSDTNDAVMAARHPSTRHKRMGDGSSIAIPSFSGEDAFPPSLRATGTNSDTVQIPPPAGPPADPAVIELYRKRVEKYAKSGKFYWGEYLIYPGGPIRRGPDGYFHVTESMLSKIPFAKEHQTLSAKVYNESGRFLRYHYISLLPGEYQEKDGWGTTFVLSAIVVAIVMYVVMHL